MSQQEEYQDQANVEEMTHQQDYQLQEIIEYQRSSTQPTDISQEIYLVQKKWSTTTKLLLRTSAGTPRLRVLH
jgi:hypothetical protein